jgi:succinyl-CoA synthetase beta subunit
MEVHEFQAKQLLHNYGIPCPEGLVAISAEEAEAAAHSLGSTPVVVKAQILAGDRFRAGGVRMAASPTAAKAIAANLVGRRLITDQTGPAGGLAKRVLIEKKVDIKRELYLSLTIDDRAGGLILIGGAQGGDDIEDRAASDSAALFSKPVAIQGPIGSDVVALFCERFGLSGSLAEACGALIRNIHRAFIELDASLIEINPLAITSNDRLVAVDVKMIIDDNALFRHSELAELRDADELDEIELKAQRHQINFYRMDGDIGVIVNGAGLALATLDMIHEAGGRPANFMDIRTTAKSMDIAQGVSMVLDNPQTKVLLVNVYGGGMQPCDTIIDGLGIAIRRKGRVLPIVLRMTGNNEDMAWHRLANFNLRTVSFPDMWEAVTRAVSVAKRSAV